MSNYYTGYPDLDTKLSHLYDIQAIYEKQGWDSTLIIRKQGRLIRTGEERKSIFPNETRRDER